VLAPDVVAHDDPDADDAGGRRRCRLVVHADQRELPGLVDALGEQDHLLVLPRPAQRRHR
jgi:hypothetical protein